MPVIPAMWEPEVRTIAVPGQTSQKVLRTPSQQKKLDMVCTPVIPVTEGSLKLEDHSLAHSGQNLRPYLQNNHSKNGWQCGSSGRVPA
jgi:hypothetical protein